MNGANIIRAHNVKAAKETITIIDAIMKVET
jgi:dihydropteroate synthase